MNCKKYKVSGQFFYSESRGMRVHPLPPACGCPLKRMLTAHAVVLNIAALLCCCTDGVNAGVVFQVAGYCCRSECSGWVHSRSFVRNLCTQIKQSFVEGVVISLHYVLVNFVAALLRVARVTAGLAESNGSLPPSPTG